MFCYFVKWIYIEKVEDYCKIAEERIKGAQSEK